MGSSFHQNQYPYFDHVKTYCLDNYPVSPSTFPVIQGETTLFPVMSAYDNSEGWYIDSGATAHTTKRKDWLKNFSATTNGIVKVANNEKATNRRQC
jgi:hypothetical protein